MNDKDRKNFFMLMYEIKKVYPSSKLNTDGIAAYFEKLKKYTYEQVSSAFDSIINYSTFLPTIAEVVQHIERPNEKALSAWLEVEHAIRLQLWDFNVRFNDLVIHAVILSFGGFYEMSHTEEPLHFLEKEFMKRYEFYRTKNVLNVPAALYSKLPLSPEIFNLSMDGHQKIKEFYYKKSAFRIELMKKHLLELELKQEPEDKWERHELIGMKLSLKEQIKELEDRLNKNELVLI